MFSNPNSQDKLKELFGSSDSEQAAMQAANSFLQKMSAKGMPTREQLQSLLKNALNPSGDLAVSPRLQHVIGNWEACITRLGDPKVEAELGRLRTALFDWDDQAEKAEAELDALELQVVKCLLDETHTSQLEPTDPSISLGQRQRALVCLMGQLRTAAKVAQKELVFAENSPQLLDGSDLAAKNPEIRPIAVMFTDMADSTEFAETFGSLEAYKKRERHNQLLLPLLDQYSGQLVKIIGDALLVFFENAQDAARCGIAMQRRLADYNDQDYIDAKAVEIHVRVGIHYGKTMVFQERGQIDLAGRTVNMAARVESGGGKQTDQILISDAMLAQLLPFEEFATEPAAMVQAKGIAEPVQLHQLLWQDEAISAWKRTQQHPSTTKPAQTLAAATAKRLAAVEANSNSRGCQALFVDPESGQGFVVPVWVKLSTDETPGIGCKIDCDQVMRAAGERAITAAFDILPQFGFREARIEQQAIEWWIDAEGVRFEGASLGLALALATVAAYTGTEIDPKTAVTGAIDGNLVVPVMGLGNKWAALRDTKRIDKLVLPSANLNDLPNDARHDGDMQIIDVPNLEAAVLDVLGAGLGLASSRLSAPLSPHTKQTTDGINVQLWIQPKTNPTLTRDIRISPKEQAHNWFIGDEIRLCARVNHDCHLSLINIGPTGNVTILVPNSHHPESWVRADEEVTFPPRQSGFFFDLQGPPGRERVIAIATDSRPNFSPEDFNQSGAINARPTTRDIAVMAKDLATRELARCELEFYVSDRNSPPPLGTTRGIQPFPLD